VNAAKAGAVPLRSNGLARGDRADFVQFRLGTKIEVTATWLSGRRVFQTENPSHDSPDRHS